MVGKLGYSPSVPVLAHLSQSEQSYLEKWPSGIKQFESATHGFTEPGLGSESVSIPVPWDTGRWASDTRPIRTGFWLGSLGYSPSVPVLAHRLGQSEQSYLEKWPTGIKVCLSCLQHGFTTTRTWERNLSAYRCPGSLGGGPVTPGQ